MKAISAHFVVLVTLLGVVGKANAQDFKRVSFDEFFDRQVVSLPLSLEIPSQYVHASGLKIPVTYSYWMKAEEVTLAAKSQDLPVKTGYIYGKLTPNEGFDRKSGKFTSEEQAEAQIAQAGMKLIEKKRFEAQGYPVFSYIVQAKNGAVVCSLFVATLVETNVLYVGYRPPNNDLRTARKVWARILTSLGEKG